MNSTVDNDCVCTLLSQSENDQVGEWSDFMSQNGGGTVAKTINKPKQQQKRITRFGYGSINDQYKFQHHKTYSDFIKDYNAVYLKAGAYRQTYANPVQYGGPYSQRPPVLHRKNRCIMVKSDAYHDSHPSQSTITNTTDNPTGDNTHSHVESSRAHRHRPVDTRKLLSYDDIKDYITDECEDEVEGRTRNYLKARKTMDVNLTGRFMKRVSGTQLPSSSSTSQTVTEVRVLSATKSDTISVANTPPYKSDNKVIYGSSQTLDGSQPVLAVPPKPAPSVNYKLPASLPYKVTTRPPSQSARLERTSPRYTPGKDSRAENSIEKNTAAPYRLAAKQTTVSKSMFANSGSMKQPTFHTTQRYETNLSRSEMSNNFKLNSIVKHEFSRSNLKTDKERKRQLQELVKILGQSSLTPYIQKLRGLEAKSITRHSPAVNKAELLDYSVVFGTRL